MQKLGDVATARTEFERWLERQPLAERTKSEYRRNVRVFLDWLAAADDDGWDADPLGDRLARDHAARDFRRWLKVERRAAASTVNLALASLDALYRQRGLLPLVDQPERLLVMRMQADVVGVASRSANVLDRLGLAFFDDDAAQPAVIGAR